MDTKKRFDKMREYALKNMEYFKGEHAPEITEKLFVEVLSFTDVLSIEFNDAPLTRELTEDELAQYDALVYLQYLTVQRLTRANEFIASVDAERRARE